MRTGIGPSHTKMEHPTDMKLYATPLSHFSRKIRILLDLYKIAYEFVDIKSVIQTDKSVFANNPLMKVPVLIDETNWLIDSDHIAKYVVEKFDPADQFRVNSSTLHELNTRAILNTIMSEEVKLILSRRTGLPTDDYVFFDKCKLTIKNGLDWLESNYPTLHGKSPGYLEFHLTCLLEHLAYYELVPLNYPNLAKIVDACSANNIISSSSPLILKPKDSASIKK